MKPALIVTALLTIATIGGAIVYQAEAREREYREFLATGDAALAAGDTSVAVERFSGAIALRPDSMLAHLRRGETYRQRGELEAAGLDFRRASVLDPSATRPLDAWGDTLYQQQRFKRAAEVYDARLRLDERSATIRYRLALALYRAGSYSEAMAAAEQALALDNTLNDATYLIGLCHKALGRRADALVAFQKAVSRTPGSIPAREELADLYRLMNRPAQEIEQLQVLAGLDGGRVERRVAVALAHARSGHSDLAVLTLGSALDQIPEQPQLYGALGRVWLTIAEAEPERADALANALKALERAARSPGATSEMKRLYGRALLLNDQSYTAERVLQEATTTFPADPEAFAAYASLAERRQHLAEARTALMAYVALVGDLGDAAVHAVHIGRLSLRLHDAPSAVSWLRRAALAAPKSIDAHVALAEAEWLNGDRAAADAAVRRGLQLEPANQPLLALSRRLAS